MLTRKQTIFGEGGLAYVILPMSWTFFVWLDYLCVCVCVRVYLCVYTQLLSHVWFFATPFGL